MCFPAYDNNEKIQSKLTENSIASNRNEGHID